jgi:hypothetical protein
LAQRERERKQNRHESATRDSNPHFAEIASRIRGRPRARIDARRDAGSAADLKRDSPVERANKPGTNRFGAIRFPGAAPGKSASRRVAAIAPAWLRSGQLRRGDVVPARETAVKARTKAGRIGIGQFARVIRRFVNPSPRL